MNDKNEIDILLRRSAGDVPPLHTASADQLHARIISGETSLRKLRLAMWGGVFPASAAIGLFSMWMMSLPGDWMALATLANAGLFLAFFALIKWMVR